MKTLTELQQKIHRTYEGDTDYPTSGDEDWTLRTGFINDSIDLWAFEGARNGIRWRELFVDLDDAADGDTTTDATGVYDTPSDFREISSLVKIGDVYHDYISADKVLIQTNRDSSKRYFYITGNASTGHKLHINPTSSTGETISYSYYKTPTALSSGTDTVEISNPEFLVAKVLARLQELDFRNDLVTFYEDRATEIMEGMVIDNEIPPSFNENNLDDYGWLRSGEAFGK
jgi:hypothetical protein